MVTPMKARVSALMDGELEGHETIETLRALRRDDVLRSDAAAYQLIGDALRGEPDLEIDVSAQVMSTIELEPAVVVLMPRRTMQWQRPVLALAASAAGVAVVAWLALAPTGGADTAANLASMKPAVLSAAADPASRLRLQEYLVAHQVYAPGGAITGGANHIRTVAASGGEH